MNTSVLAADDGTNDPLDSDPTTSGAREIPRAVEPELAPGTSIHGKYVVDGVLGYGGFAVVYDAEHLGLGRQVAIKVLHLRDDRPLALVERFRREARVSALVKHPNVLEVYDTGALHDGSPYLVMERLRGETLSACIARGPLPIAGVVELGRQLMRGLAAVHDAGIVHRDIKPDNVMLHDPGDGPRTVKLVDFGIARRVGIEPAARLTCHGALVGTPQYMSPEQIRGEDVDLRTDIYAAGAVLYEALTGHAPHECDNFSELVVAVLNAKLERVRKRRASCPSELEYVVMRALSRDRALRPSTARDMLAALEEVGHRCRLPTGDAAFVAEDAQPRRVADAARGSLGYARRLWPSKLAGSRPLSLTLVAAALAAQGSFGLLYGDADDGSDLPASASDAARDVRATALTSSAAPLAPITTQLEERVLPRGATVPVESFARARAESAGPSERPRRDREPEPSAHAGSAATSERELVSAESETPPAVESVQPEAPVDASTAVGAPQPASAPAVVVAPVIAVPAATPQAAVVPRRAPRAVWEQAMQAALAELVRGRLDTAKSRYQEAVRLDVREPAGYRGLALVAVRLGQAREAREALARYVALAPQAKDAELIAARIAALPK